MKSASDSFSWMEFFPFVLVRLGGLSFEKMDLLCAPELLSFLGKTQEAEAQTATAKTALLDALTNALETLPENEIRTSVYQLRKRLFQGKNVDFGGFFKENVIVSSNWMENFKSAVSFFEEKKQSQIAYNEAAEKAYNTAVELAFSDIGNLCDAAFMAGLSNSSRSLTQQAISFFEKTEKPNNKSNRQLVLGLYQALARAAYKTSPLGHWGPIAPLSLEQWPKELPPFSFEKTTATANVALLDLLFNLLSDELDFHLLQPVRLNPSLLISDTGHFDFLAYIDGEERVQRFETHEQLLFLHEKVKHAMPYKRIAKGLSRETEVPKLDCMEFVQTLLWSGFFVWEKPPFQHQSNWAEKMIQHLVALPEPDRFFPAIELLKWLSGTAKLFPHQNLQERLRTQKEGAEMLQQFAHKMEIGLDGIQTERLWYENSSTDVLPDFSAAELENLIDALRAELQSLWRFPLSPKQALAVQFFKKTYRPKETVPALVFLKKLLQEGAHDEKPTSARGMVVDGTAAGALLQPYRDEQGNLCAVLNGLHIGGGKLLNRFLPFFPEKTWQTMAAWSQFGVEAHWADFAWSSPSNVNFHPFMASAALDLPEGVCRGKSPQERIGLNDLGVRLSEDGFGFCELVRLSDGMPVYFLETTPEAADSLPPLLQFLRALGTPFLSVSVFREKYANPIKTDFEGQYQPRTVFPMARNIVLQRASWTFPTVVFPKETGFGFFQWLFSFFKKNELPNLVFYRKTGKKPQFLSLENPISVLAFEKFIRKNTGKIILEEALPLPQQSLFQTEKGKRVGELAVEFRL